jgi:hypothetical protein
MSRKSERMGRRNESKGEKAASLKGKGCQSKPEMRHDMNFFSRAAPCKGGKGRSQGRGSCGACAGQDS